MDLLKSKIIDFSDYQVADRQGTYGGQAGGKDSIIYEGNYWIIKYPKNTRSMKGNNLSPYTTSPLSEYIGSHIYDILGFDVHETLLGIRNGKVIVACKDFCKTRGLLLEVRSIKNAADYIIPDSVQEVMSTSVTGDMVDLNELFIHFKYNPLLMEKDIHDRFWDMVIIDILIDNNDRNNGNWGLLYDEGTKKNHLAPIYDNGNSFSNKASEEQIRKDLKEENINKHLDIRTPYVLDGHTLSAKKLLQLNNKDLRKALMRNIPLIKEKFQIIADMVESIPEYFKEYQICSNERKQYYIKGMEIRLNELLLPALQGVQQNILTDNDRQREMD